LSSEARWVSLGFIESVKGQFGQCIASSSAWIDQTRFLYIVKG
jgi:hypothetical protein